MCVHLVCPSEDLRDPFTNTLLFVYINIAFYFVYIYERDYRYY